MNYKELEETLGFIGLLTKFKIRVQYVVESDYQEIDKFDTLELANAFAVEYSKTTDKPVVVIKRYLELEKIKNSQSMKYKYYWSECIYFIFSQKYPNMMVIILESYR